EFDPTLYGMAAEYDAKGDYKYPDGFDPETNEWLEGFETQRETWEKQYADAHARWEAHRAQVEAAAKADAEAAGSTDATSYSSESGVSSEEPEARPAGPSAPAENEGTLASDEALAALREKLTGN
ncbi:MAG: 30S ribosomal protein S1, partial [Ornithinibacter sp.]